MFKRRKLREKLHRLYIFAEMFLIYRTILISFTFDKYVIECFCYYAIARIFNIFTRTYKIMFVFKS